MGPYSRGILSLTIILVAGAVGCGQECEVDGDCGAAVCRDQVCVGSCAADSDCPLRSRCDRDQAVPECVVGCVQDRSCPADEVCSSGSRCVPGCRGDEFCALGAICSQLQCVPGCRDSAECPSGEACIAQACVPGCRDDSECLEDQICNRVGDCVGGCRLSRDCPSGQKCTPDNECREVGSCVYLDCTLPDTDGCRDVCKDDIYEGGCVDDCSRALARPTICDAVDPLTCAQRGF